MFEKSHFFLKIYGKSIFEMIFVGFWRAGGVILKVFDGFWRADGVILKVFLREGWKAKTSVALERQLNLRASESNFLSNIPFEFSEKMETRSREYFYDFSEARGGREKGQGGEKGMPGCLKNLRIHRKYLKNQFVLDDFPMDLGSPGGCILNAKSHPTALKIWKRYEN